ncbi:YggS family pyridoxal phosphate-dependent enzyme [Arenicella sp.]|nr:YggS family pyridoxal phosphate-dependent enzyme [Arenicella sp.]
MSNRDFASKQLNMIKNRIRCAAISVKRDPTTIKLVGASKQKSAEILRSFYLAGLSNMGENYLQEALVKQAELNDLSIDWHFIGKPQSNKCKTIAQHFDWVHSVDRLKIAQRLAQFRSAQEKSPINLLIQLNVDQEQSKGGIAVAQAPSLCAQISDLENVQLRGFMLIPKATDSIDQQRRPFAAARDVLERTNQRYGLGLDTLSMGMSSDLEAAINEGATIIRIGSALFGART